MRRRRVNELSGVSRISQACEIWRVTWCFASVMNSCIKVRLLWSRVFVMWPEAKNRATGPCARRTVQVHK